MAPIQDMLDDPKFIVDTIEKTIAQEEACTFQASINSVDIGMD